MSKRKPKPPMPVYIVVAVDGAPLAGWYEDAGDAACAIDEEMLEENCGPCRIVKYVPNGGVVEKQGAPDE